MEHQETYTDTVRRVIEVSRILTEVITREEWEAIEKRVSLAKDRKIQGLQKQERYKKNVRP